MNGQGAFDVEKKRFSDEMLAPFGIDPSLFSEPRAAGSVVGLEPSTTELDDRFAYRTLKAGESVRFALTLSVTDERA